MPDRESWKALHTYLAKHRADEEEIGQLIEALGRFQEAKLPIKVFPKGIPFPDGVIVHTVVDRDRVQDLMKLVFDQPRLDVIRLFPRGIVLPDVFAAEIELR